MGKATTTKRINPGLLLGQLSAETVRVGGGDLESDEEKTIEVDDMTDEEIAAALEEYSHDENHGRPRSEVGLRQARQKARAVAKGDETFTDEEMQGAVARLVLRSLQEDE